MTLETGKCFMDREKPCLREGGCFVAPFSELVCHTYSERTGIPPTANVGTHMNPCRRRIMSGEMTLDDVPAPRPQGKRQSLLVGV
jgi:hypothetical protein